MLILRAGAPVEGTRFPVVGFKIDSTTRGGRQAVASGKHAINTGGPAADEAGKAA